MVVLVQVYSKNDAKEQLALVVITYSSGVAGQIGFLIQQTAELELSAAFPAGAICKDDGRCLSRLRKGFLCGNLSESTAGMALV